MRIVVSLLTAVCFIVAAEASAIAVATPQSQALPSAPSPAPSTLSGSRRCFARSWQATARPRVSGSAVASSATRIASNVVVFSADPFGTLGNLGRHLFSRTAQARLARDALQVGRFRALTVQLRQSATVLF